MHPNKLGALSHVKNGIPWILITGVFVVVVATVWGAARPMGQAIQITGGPTIERAVSNAALISWSTSQASSSRIWYGTDPNNLTQLAEARYSAGNNHRVELTNLQPGTTYYFQLESQRGNNEAQGEGVMSFWTPAPGQEPIVNQPAQLAKQAPNGAGDLRITQGPVLEDVSSNSAVVAWSTNMRGSTRVNFGTDPNNLTGLAEAPWGVGGRTHRAELRNLQPDTTYYFRVETGQAQGNHGGEIETQRVMSFRTVPLGAAPVRNEPPQ